MSVDVVGRVRALVAGWSPGELRWLLGFERDVPVPALELAAVVDAYERAGQLQPLVVAWAFAERVDPFRIDCASIAALIAAGADWYRASHHFDELGSPAAPEPPADQADGEAFGRLLALAAASGVAVEWRSLPHADGLASRSSTGPVVFIRPGAGAHVLAHELAHLFDPRAWPSLSLPARERFADELAGRLIAGRVSDPVRAQRLAVDLVDELDAVVLDEALPVALDLADRVRVARWFEELTG